ncbi:unnamed protein product [Acanthoscelides obtectus]|uniref:MADF domain-containing protein n=1 Tax=Acanthoscelides obtectus TaxID=200917 RepID=A0A9P0KTW7_ACAOB|nr:unnamed protein product [Acanthoscelides obtectus]CAK1655916.1 hypothetical protein AOBTE_LOCUS19435 [Acanthoscelides obtectus]
MKWNSNNIVEFLNIYQQYPVLWNIKDKDYCNTKLKDGIFQRLFNELNEKQLIGGMDVMQLKAKIKSIKDVYRQELHKIKRSMKSGCGTEEVHSPKLAWFNEANYMEEVMATRSSKSNLDISENSSEEMPEESSESCRESAQSDKDNCQEGRLKNKSPTKMIPPATSTKRAKRRAAPEKSPSEISEAINHLDKIAQNAAEEKPYDGFGKYVASELRQLPQRQAILLQQEIQNCIIQSKLSSLEHIVDSTPEPTNTAFSPSSNQSLASHSSNDDEDVLKQVMITFGPSML